MKRSRENWDMFSTGFCDKLNIDGKKAGITSDIDI